jgi:hypothetical protein
MVLILLFAFIGAIAVAISMIHYSFGGLAGSGIAREDLAVARERTGRPTVAGQKTQFLVVVLPDGKIVNPVVADRL